MVRREIRADSPCQMLSVIVLRLLCVTNNSKICRQHVCCLQFSTAAVHAAEEQREAASKEAHRQALFPSLSSSSTPTKPSQPSVPGQSPIIRLNVKGISPAVCEWKLGVAVAKLMYSGAHVRHGLVSKLLCCNAHTAYIVVAEQTQVGYQGSICHSWT